MPEREYHKNVFPITDIKAGCLVWKFGRDSDRNLSPGEAIRTCDPFFFNGYAYGHYVSDGAPITNPDFAVIAFNRDHI